MKVKSEKQINMIRGALAKGVATKSEIKSFLDYVEALEALVDESSMEDFYGTEGWKFRIGWDS